MMQTIKKQWFLVSLVLIFAAVIFDGSDSLARLGISLKNNHGPDVIIFIIFIFSGLLIESDQIIAGIKDIKATALALSVIIIFAPLAALALSLIPMDTGIVIGLFIVAVMPTTLSSGIVMTGAAGGNMAHALFVTILSNFIGIFSIPIILSLLLALFNQGKDLAIDQKAIVLKLILLVCFPLAIGIMAKARIFREDQLARFKLQVVNQCLIVVVVFISLGGAKQVLLGKGPAVFEILILVSVFHLLLLGFSFFLVQFFKVGKGRRESVVFMGSQKTLALAVMIQVTYFSEFGIALLVCVIHHIVHLMMDGYLSTRLHQGLSGQNE
jgi:sodium/bile acid cotransporter 7